MADKNVDEGSAGGYIRNRIPGFDKVLEELETAFSQGLLPEPVGRDLEEEQEIYCEIKYRLAGWKISTPTDFAEHFADYEGMAHLDENKEWLTRTAVIIGIFARHDHTIFLQEKPRRQEQLTHHSFLPQKLFNRSSGMKMRQPGDDSTFPQLEDIYRLVMPQGWEDPAHARQRCIVKGIYWIIQNHYLVKGRIPPFREISDEVGIGADMKDFPMAFYTWAVTKDLHFRLSRQTDES